MCRILYTQGSKIFQIPRCRSRLILLFDFMNFALMGYDALIPLTVYPISNLHLAIVILAAGQRKLLLCGFLNDNIVVRPGFKLIDNCDLSRHGIVTLLILMHLICSIAPANYRHESGG